MFECFCELLYVSYRINNSNWSLNKIIRNFQHLKIRKYVHSDMSLINYSC